MVEMRVRNSQMAFWHQDEVLPAFCMELDGIPLRNDRNVRFKASGGRVRADLGVFGVGDIQFV